MFIVKIYLKQIYYYIYFSILFIKKDFTNRNLIFGVANFLPIFYIPRHYLFLYFAIPASNLLSFRQYNLKNFIIEFLFIIIN
jgi:hypothetical protein